MKHIVSTINTTIILSFLFCCTGCGFLDGSEEYEASPHEAYILSISDDRPAEVVIGGIYYFPTTCGSATGASVERDGNDIYFAIKVSEPTGPGDCGDAVTEVYGEATVKNLEVGEYIIKGKGDHFEFARIRIEPDTAYTFVNFSYLNFIIKAVTLNDKEHIGDTYHVTAVLGLPAGWYNCEPIVKTDIKRTQDVINIEAWQVVPKTDCQIILDPFKITDQYERKSIDIDLGTFSTGSYTVIINDIENTFEIPPPFTN